MRLINTPLQDAYLIEFVENEDTRGSFSRLFCSQFLKDRGIADHHPAQINFSTNKKQGTLRGLHYQAHPYLEAKIVYCLEGAIYDTIVDLRKGSPTYLEHFSITLSPKAKRALFVPKGFAHGFLTLKDNSCLLYLMSECYQTGYERGYRYDDPAFSIQWPTPPTIISERDHNLPYFVSDHAFL